ncbi:MAG: EAL domain-containing protein [Pseudomonadota bacterium]|nr:EAL domain-containing protein [Pseudomonadota bacterium]
MTLQLRSKLLLLTLPFMVLPILLFGWVSSERIENISHENLDRAISHNSQQIERLINNMLSVGESNLTLFSQNDFVVQYLLSSEHERYSLLHPNLLNTFHAFHKAYPDYYEIRLILPDGYEDVRFANYAENVTEEEINHPVIQKLVQSNSESIFMFALNPDNQIPSAYFARKINLSNFAKNNFTKAPTLRGYLVLTSTLESVQKQLDSMEHDLKVKFVLASLDNEILLKSGYSDDLNDVLASSQIKTLLEQQFTQPASEDFTKKMYHQSSFEFGTIEYGFDNHLLNNSLNLYGIYPVSLYLTEGRQVQVILLVLVLLSIGILSFVLIQGLNKLVLQPISILAHATQFIGNNTKEVNIPVKREDEFGQLARSFERMNKKLLSTSESIKKQAFTDSLTDLPNRLMFREFLEGLLSKSHGRESRFAILFIDLDNFKVVNDTLGHDSGDLLLKAFASRITKVVRGDDYISTGFGEEENKFIARLGGDEFIVALHEIASIQDVSLVANRIIQALAEPIMLNDYEYYGSSSIGAAVYPEDGTSSEMLIKHADVAMYYAKQMGKNAFHFYSKQMSEKNEELNYLEAELRKSLRDQSGLELFYQPQIDIKSGLINGFEALLRWTLDGGESVNPETIIAMAEQRALIVPLTDWIVDEACRQNALWHNSGLIKVPVAVNFSGLHIIREDISNMILESLDKYGLEPQFFEVEMTESVLVDSSAEVLESFAKIRGLGVSISIDDFGTGFSSLSYLSTYPVDNIKIDRSFISKINQNKHSAIVTAIIQMSHAFGCTVIAEGVETQEQLNFLKTEGCDVVQGYLYSRPIPAESVDELLGNIHTLVN